MTSDGAEQARVDALEALIARGEVVTCLCGEKCWAKEFAPIDPRCDYCKVFEAADPDGPSVQALLAEQLKRNER